MSTTSKTNTKMIPTHKALAKKKALARKAKPRKAPAKKVMGRPTRYQVDFNAKAEQLALHGATDKKIAEILGIAERTLNYWKQKHPDVLRSITRGKTMADARVAEALFQRARGYAHPETKFFVVDKEVVTRETTKHYPPDTAAASFWLRHRQPELWRDQKFLNEPEEPEEKPESTEDLIKGIAELNDQLKILESQL
jgi:hypothetical protein